MIWEDPRTVDLIESNTLSDPTYICQAWCSTEQGTDILLEELGVPNNATGQAACCDNVFVPGSIAQNVIGYDVQVLYYSIIFVTEGLLCWYKKTRL